MVPMYNFIKYSDSYSKILGSSWQYHRDESALYINGITVDFPGNSALFKLKGKINKKNLCCK